MIVVDASAMIELLIPGARAPALESRVFQDGVTVHVPGLLDVEVAQVLRRYVAHGRVTPARAAAALDTLLVVPMERYRHEPLMRRVWQHRDNLTAYDAVYVALAEGLRAPLITCDARLAAAPGLRTSVELFD